VETRDHLKNGATLKSQTSKKLKNKTMAKIIQLFGWYSTDKKEQKIIFNADHITTITTAIENNATTTCINIESYNLNIFAPSIYTKLSVDDVIKLIND
jgi:hypothetical protein